MIYASTPAEVIPGARVMHLTTGGHWKVLTVKADGSIFARSDLGARRTVKAETVTKCLRRAADRQK